MRQFILSSLELLCNIAIVLMPVFGVVFLWLEIAEITRRMADAQTRC